MTDRSNISAAILSNHHMADTPEENIDLATDRALSIIDLAIEHLGQHPVANALFAARAEILDIQVFSDQIGQRAREAA